MVHTPVSCESRGRRVPWFGGLIGVRSDLKGMTKISSSIMILRNATASAWTKDLDDKMNNWLLQYIYWLENSPLALGEKVATKFVLRRSKPWFSIDPVSVQQPRFFLLQPNRRSQDLGWKQRWSSGFTWGILSRHLPEPD